MKPAFCIQTGYTIVRFGYGEGVLDLLVILKSRARICTTSVHFPAFVET
jgi:hypothetical protein